jgi:hypothetical protein
LPALLLATAGGLLQAAFSLCVWAAGDRTEEDGASGWNRRRAASALAANLTLRSTSARHAIRFGAALAAGQRAAATAIGILIAAAAFLIWSNPRSGEEGAGKPGLAPPEATAR